MLAPMPTNGETLPKAAQRKSSKQYYPNGAYANGYGGIVIVVII